jgi:hypothetical protein
MIKIFTNFVILRSPTKSDDEGSGAGTMGDQILQSGVPDQLREAGPGKRTGFRMTFSSIS